MSTPELRQLLDSSRSRGHAAQSYRILQEMAARRDAEPEPRKRKARPHRRPPEPRVISIDLGDPLEPEPEFRQDDAVPDDFEVPPMPNADPSDDPIAGLTLGSPAPAAAPAPETPRKRRGGFAVFTVGAVLGVAAGWAGATVTAGEGALPMPQLAGLSLPKMAMPDLSAFMGSSTPAAEPKGDIEVAELPPAPTGEAAPPPGLEIVAAPADAMAVDAAAHAPLPEAIPQPTPAVALPPPPPPPVEEDACAGEATPADRAICADPSLQKLQRDLRQAYARALDAHADRATLRQRQLAWRDARDAVEDPRELAALYEARIRKLNTATAEARKLAGL